jgi:glycine betaine/choline ABC-type transport system substrate-binding protein
VAPEEFLVDRPDGLPGLKKFYRGFNFKSIRPAGELTLLGEQYDVLNDDKADVIYVSSTDPEIKRYHLRILVDDHHFWPPYKITPVVRLDACSERLKVVLNSISRALSQEVLQQLDDHVEAERDPADVAQTFVSSIHLATH